MPILASQRIGKVRTLNMRTTSELRKKLEAAASQSGRSMTAEVEHRVQRSFDQEAVVDALAERFFRRSSQ